MSFFIHSFYCAILHQMIFPCGNYLEFQVRIPFSYAGYSFQCATRFMLSLVIFYYYSAVILVCGIHILYLSHFQGNSGLLS